MHLGPPRNSWRTIIAWNAAASTKMIVAAILLTRPRGGRKQNGQTHARFLFEQQANQRGLAGTGRATTT